MRLSNLCAELIQKEENRNKITGAMDRLNKQNNGIQGEIYNLNNRNAVLKAKTQELLKNASSDRILAAAELGDAQLANIEFKNQVNSTDTYLVINVK